MTEIERHQSELYLLKDHGTIALDVFLRGLTKTIGLKAIKTALPKLVAGIHPRSSWIAEALIGGPDAPLQIVEEEDGYAITEGTSSLRIDIVPEDLKHNDRLNWLTYLVRKAPKPTSNASDVKRQVLEELV